MTGAKLKVVAAGPGMTVQDGGRPGYLARGLSAGGAADARALAEGAALLGQGEGAAAIEMAGMGGSFEVTGETVAFALTGAPMRAALDGAALGWNTTHIIAPGQKLVIGPALAGTFGYLNIGGGIATQPFMGGRGTHIAAGIGGLIETGQEFPLAKGMAEPGMALDVTDRFSGGLIRVLAGPQSDLFDETEKERFIATEFTRDPRGNRMGVQLAFEGEGFAASGGLTIVSETIVPGDIQMTGAGTPYVLGPECQTTGGYPRLASVVPSDMPKVMQAAPGTKLRFAFVSRDEALALWKVEMSERSALKPKPLVRDPHDIADLLSYQLIDGVTDGGDEP